MSAVGSIRFATAGPDRRVRMCLAVARQKLCFLAPLTSFPEYPVIYEACCCFVRILAGTAIAAADALASENICIIITSKFTGAIRSQ